jgi:hypothetical protein
MAPQGGGLWIPALANFHVQYNFQCISIVLDLMSSQYEKESWEKTLLTASVFAGMRKLEICCFLFDHLLSGFLSYSQEQLRVN